MMTKIKPFQNSGGFTTFENSILDYIMPECKPNTWKVICVTLRQTVGWEDKKTGKRKAEDQISFSQYMEKTGIKNRTTLNDAIQDALDNDYLIRHPDGQSFKYSINRDYEFETSTEIVPVQKSDQKRYGNRTGTGTETVHTKEKLKQTIKQKEGARKNALPPQAKTFEENGGKFRPGKLKDGTTKKDNAIAYMVANIPDDSKALEFWGKVVEGYCVQWSSYSFKTMVDSYFKEGRIPGQNGKARNNGFWAGDQNKTLPKSDFEYPEGGWDLKNAPPLINED